ncbi:tannase/feruloyl esterase family alpha/beta hydrolase [uncultured Alsobacter sp.]|uniref:tannase/feruloyl esterase family alpha/beta hydrolase n=1 Tax=uncultured Alsobacter sp. TaxID=1748258 RepID=UPI0025FEA5B6|nr:tannase/feruloyl esterase family alpha/beta hydrolase [uncultured Alsobacter sp.]
MRTGRSGGPAISLSLLAPTVLASLTAMPALAQEDACARLTAGLPGLTGVTIASAAMQDAANGLPRHCLVKGKANERTGADGKSYAIQFEVRLPEDWNGRFLHQVNGGNDGVVVPALGDRPEALPSGGRTPLAQGFAVLSSDSGHSGSDPANAAMGLAAGAAFGLDPQARRDYGFTGTATMAPVGKAIVAARYGKAPTRSYIYGCSNGGRHAMVAASRTPDAYDGFLVGNPGFELPRAAVQHAWDVQAFTKVDPDIRKSITRDDAQLISRRITETCDGLDGATDGITANVKACQAAFRFDSLACKAGETQGCLAPTKVEALKTIFAGPKNSKGETLYADWPADGGVGLGNWRFWKVESTIPGWNNYPTISTMGAASLALVFSTPPVKIEGNNEALMAFLRGFDFDRDAPAITAKGGAFAESSMDFMTPPDVDNPTLSGFAAAGRKMVIFHGQSDPVFSFNSTVRWYEALDRNVGGKAADMTRIFGLPGITHCGGGPGLEKFDALGALVDWVEKGKAPDRIVASVNPSNKEIPAGWSPGRTRPLCPWPTYARYKGGDVESEASFECAKP